MRILGLAALSVLVACAPLKKGQRSTVYRQEMLDDWIGSSAGELVEKWGPPDSTFARPDGVVTYTYERKTQYAKIRSSSYAVGGKGYAVGSTKANVDPAGRTLCRTFFDIDGNQVIRGSFKGSSCELFGRPFLGVFGSPVEDGLLVEKVVPRSSAHRFGIEPGMVLVELDGKPIRKQPDVDFELADRHAEDEVRVKLRVSPSTWKKGVIELLSEPR